jgi:hypothetical protein
MPPGAAEMAGLSGATGDATAKPLLTEKVRNPWGCGPFLADLFLADGSYFATAGTPAVGALATPPAAFLEPRRSIQMASRETEKLIAM